MQQSSDQSILDYGTQRRWNPRRLLLKAIASLALIVVAWFSIDFAWSQLFKDEVDVRRELESIPGGRVINVNYFDDSPGTKVISALLSIDGGPIRTIGFRAPHAYALRCGEGMLIDDIGPYSILLYLGGEPWPQPFNVGKDGELASVLPFKFNNVRDVASHYEEIVAFVAANPSGTFSDSAGNVRTWRIEVRPRGSTGR